MSVDFKQPRITEDREGWEELRRTKIAPCRVCGRVDVTLHHLVPRSLGGDDVEFNLIPLCGAGTTGCHGLFEAADAPIRSVIRRSLTLDELAYVFGKKGPGFLDRYYPWSEAA